MRHRTEAEYFYKLAHGRWPKPAVRPAARRLTRHAPASPKAELPKPERGEARLTIREIRERLTAMKLAGGCADCGFRSHAAALDFDHVRGHKAVNLSTITSRYWSVVEHEVAKCEVVCATCHRVRHANRKGARNGL